MDMPEFKKPSLKGLNLNEELFRKYIRVLKLARTPTKEEFSKIALVAGIGILIIGLIGFILYEFMLILPS
ncbi:protein transport protein SEC61 subunit gamma-like protein [Methanocalculus alkaliphilus]|uniref:protein translocase SEC61 complex subunit gamma n=1 Tax=Methanocalculus alkaliphilus TaxID=768730 RepID=UPI0020A07990|nr:protein translocase SEC61 complex subunit gamma [Methanocalculus alkaliphilus]MCP1714905.1 protein transport protein SEC61 subunit gamma-like protein [Methanocalculus alkaliphilus]